MDLTSDAPMLSSSATPRRRTGMTKHACLHCRRLKMKCIVEVEGASCLRCAKSKRPCVQPRPFGEQNKQNISPPITPLHTPALSTDGAPEALWDFSPVERPHVMARSYTTPSLHTLHWSYPASVPSTTGSNATLYGLGLSHVDSMSIYSPMGDGRFSSAPSIASDSSSGEPLSRDELRHLCQFFVNNLMSQVLILADEDVRDLSLLIDQKQSLAMSMAYVASLFVPGCKSLRSRLVPAVNALASLQSQDHYGESTFGESQWTTLQALAVLYTWAPAQNSAMAFASRPKLNREMLRISIDALATRYSLHNSAQEAVAALKGIHSANDIVHVLPLRKYTYWLWLYTEAHLRSLITRSPADVREDSSIISAAAILERVLSNMHVQRIVAAVELCLIWSRMDLRQRDFGEWYCATPNRLSPNIFMSVLHEMDDNLASWRRRWIDPVSDAGSLATLAEVSLAIHERFLRFYNALYVAQAFQASSHADDLPNSIVIYTAQALDRAMELCSFFRSLNPLAKSLIGHGSETLFAMIAMCCDNIVQQRVQAPFATDLMWLSRADVVLEVAELMMEIGADEAHSSRSIGRRLQTEFLAVQVPTLKQTQPITGNDYMGVHSRTNSSEFLSMPSLVGGGGHLFEDGCNSGLTSGSQSPEYGAMQAPAPWGIPDFPGCSVPDSCGPNSSDFLMDMLPPMATAEDSMPISQSMWSDHTWLSEDRFSNPESVFA